ncbi:MAG: 3-oxoacyl-[acyl-carrier-protein] reductase [Saprospiraceae bacterium]|nr:3-oxoacyl-[acyl-carrier-protein] reductase [Saprospiraceae bacterium]
MQLLKDKVAVVTGGSRGIGEAIVRTFAEQGATVVFTYMSSREKAEGIASDIETKGGKAIAVHSDASSFVQAEGLIRQVVDAHGQLDILVNNAGITNDTLMLRMDEAQWDQVMEVNLKSVFNLTKHSLRQMLRQRSGSIINMSSVVGVFGNAGQANYAASKAGIIGFTKSIAKEVGSRTIRCNAIAPGFIETDMTGELDDATREMFVSNVPLNRMGTGDDVANAALFLASDLSVYITGQVLSVCGGLNT